MDEDRRAIIEAFEKQVVETGWFALRPALVAEAAGVPLDRARRLFPTKADLLTGLAQAIDEEVLSEGLADPNEPARDRLFEVMMRRMDALQDRRPVIEALFEQLARDPATALHHLLSVPNSMAWMLQAARIDANGLEGRLKARALMVVYALVLRVWLQDDTDDMDPTMKALDERLKFTEELANSFLPSVRTGPSAPSSNSDDEDAGGAA